MSKAQEFVQDYAAKRSQMLKEATAEEDIFMNGIGRLVCDMLTTCESITLPGLLEECSRRHTSLSQREKPEQNPEWHRLNAMIAYLQNLKK